MTTKTQKTTKTGGPTRPKFDRDRPMSKQATETQGAPAPKIEAPKPQPRRPVIEACGNCGTTWPIEDAKARRKQHARLRAEKKPGCVTWCETAPLPEWTEKDRRTLRDEPMSYRPNQTYPQEVERFGLLMDRWEKRAMICDEMKTTAAAHVVACFDKSCEDLAHVAVHGARLWNDKRSPSKADLHHLGECGKEAPGLLIEYDTEVRRLAAARMEENRAAQARSADDKLTGRVRAKGKFTTAPVPDVYCDNPAHLWSPRPIEADVEFCCPLKCYPRTDIMSELDCSRFSSIVRDRRQAEYKANPKAFAQALGRTAPSFTESKVLNRNYLRPDTRALFDLTKNIFDPGLQAPKE